MMTMIPSISKPLTTIQQYPPSGLEQSKPTFSGCTLENRRKKRCRVCRQSSVKQLKSTEPTLPNKETQNPSKDDIISLQHQLYNLPTTFHFGNGGPNKGLGLSNKAMSNYESSVERQKQRRNISSEFNYNSACSLKKNAAAAEATTGVVQSGGGGATRNNFTAEIVEEAGSHIHDQEEASDTIELIESCIVALQQVVALAKQVGPQDRRKLSPQQLGLRRANSILTTAEPTNIESREIKFVQGLEILPSPAMLPPKDDERYDDRNRRMPLKETMKKKGEVTTSQPSVVSSVGSTGRPDRRRGRRIGSSARAMMTLRGKGLPGQTHTRLDRKYNKGRRTSSPISCDHRHHHQADQALGLAMKKISRVISTEESDGTSSSLLCSSTSSGWTSQRGVSISSSSRGSEECSLTTAQTPSQHYRSLSTGSESPGGEEAREGYAGPTSSSDSLPSTTRARQVGSTSSSESQGYLPSDQASTHHRVGTTAYRTVGSTSTSRGIGLRKNGKWTKPEEKIGRLRKLKDKLAIIFHHHHHHHHDDCQGMSLFRKNKTSKDDDEAYREQQAVEKVRKSVVGKKQEGHLRSLVEGLLNHIRRHSKKSKPSKVGIRQFEKGKHAGKKAVKKLNWWQMLRHQRGGGLAKVPNKRLPKLGLGART